MRVFVAGPTGAIGPPLIAELVRQGHTVTDMTPGFNVFRDGKIFLRGAFSADIMLKRRGPIRGG